MLIIGQRTAKHYASKISDNAMFLEYASVGKEFSFYLVNEVKTRDFTQRVGKATRTLTIRSDAKIDFKENDKIVWNDKEYVIQDVTEEESAMTTLLKNKLIIMVG